MLTFLEVADVTGAPVALDDAYGPMLEDGSINILAPGVLMNDSPMGSTAVLVGDASNGTLALAADGSFTYSPNPNFNGTEVFTYQASDGGLLSGVATVFITVQPVNDPPVSADNAYAVDEGFTIDVAAPGVLGNDTDLDGDSLVVANMGVPTNGGILAWNPDGSFQYTPTVPGPAVDSFTYQASDLTTTGIALDGELGNVATVTITINEIPNVAPVAVDDFAFTKRNRPVVINVVANDFDPDGTINPGSVLLVTDTNRGVVTNNGDGTFTYVPKRNFRGTTVFSYTVEDNDVPAATSNVGTVRVNVTR